MLRQDVFTAVAEVTEAIENSGLYACLRRRGTGPEFQTNLLRALRNFSVMASRFSPAADQIIAIFELKMLLDTDSWMKLISGDDATVIPLRNRVMFLRQELPLVLGLFGQHTPVESPAAASTAEPVAVIQIRLIEDHERFSTVSRVIEALAGCQEIYDAFARLSGQAANMHLSIGAVDSGSDKSFDLFGAAALMKEFKELLLSVWDLVVFHRERKLGKQIELITASLPILEKIKDMEQKNQLDHAEAVIVRNGIIDGTKKLLASGVMLPEFANQTAAQPRQLLAPEPRLLSGPVETKPLDSHEPQAPAPSPSPPNDRALRPAQSSQNVQRPALTDEELGRLAAIMKKSSEDSSDQT